MLTNILRILLGRQIKPFKFRTEKDYLPEFNLSNIGLYVHIPFCKTICPFCPYYKIPYSRDLMENYIDALCKEIDLVAKRVKKSAEKINVTSLYLGGGTPLLAGRSIIDICTHINKHFNIKNGIGIELNPQDITDENIKILKEAEITMVSLGVQSFTKELNDNLGRDYINSELALKLLSSAKFKVIDVDLIFGIPGQTEDLLINDFKKASELGATQISTYPYINFSYSKNRYKPYGRQKKRKLLQSLIKVSSDEGFNRSSVWTFRKDNTAPYSSVTRDSYIGFGASATSLGVDSFKTNIFSVDEYIKIISNNKIPSNLTLEFTPITRGLYWIFWSIYNGEISIDKYNNMFNRNLKKDFGAALFLAKKIGFIKKRDGEYNVTEKGSYYFHLVEQVYTHQYIDKTWRSSLENPWVKEIKLY